MQNPTYDEIFQRNIGVFTPEEQEKIKNLNIAIIGVGGLGAPVAEGLARLGVGELRLVEPDTYEVSNLNRQTGAYLDTLGRNKAEVMAEFVRRINPGIKLTVKTTKLFGEELRELISGCDVVIDGIDYFNIDEELELHRIAKELKIPIVSEQACFSVISFSLYETEKSALSDLINGEDFLERIEQATRLFFPIFPIELTEEIMANMFKSYLFGQGVIGLPSYSVNSSITGAVVTKYIISYLIKTEQKNFLPIMPDILYLDTNELEFKRVFR